MFELDAEVGKWRSGLLARETMLPADLDELECHLRESVADLEARGLSEEESFLVALHRLGHPDVLAAEFAKSNGPSVWGRRFQWMLSGYLAVVMLVGLGHLVAGVAVAVGATLGVDGRSSAYLGGTVVVLCLAGWSALAMAVARGAWEGLRQGLDRLVSWLAARGPLATAAILLLVVAADRLARMPYPLVVQRLQPSELHAFETANVLYARPAVWLAYALVFAWSLLTVRGRRDSSAFETAE